MTDFDPKKPWTISIKDIDGDLSIYKCSFDLFCIIDSIIEIRKLFKEIIKKLELTPHGDFSVEFPTPWGTGGVGVTAIQSFTESYMAIDTWPERAYANLYICSCKEFNYKDIEDCIFNQFENVRIKTQNLEIVRI